MEGSPLALAEPFTLSEDGLLGLTQEDRRQHFALTATSETWRERQLDTTRGADPTPMVEKPEQASPLSRKRRIGRGGGGGGDDDDDDGNQLQRKRPRLTRKNLARLNNMT
jgi:hypothetical protein